MATVTEIIPIEGVDLEGVPPCEMMTSFIRRCLKPSMFRIRTVCSCGDKSTLFICIGCRELAVAGLTWCTRCREQRGITGYL